jgi:gamma-glutamyltranspeptidase/glutathione hydrolase
MGGCDLEIENRVPADVIDALAARGHKPRLLADYSQTVGGGQAVVHDSVAGINYGASDPRKDGAAVPEPPPYFTSPASRPPR